MFDGVENSCLDSVHFKFYSMAEMYHVSSDDLEEALSVLRSLSDYQVPVSGTSATASGSVVKMLTETVQPVVVKRCVLWVCYQRVGGRRSGFTRWCQCKGVL